MRHLHMENPRLAPSTSPSYVYFSAQKTPRPNSQIMDALKTSWGQNPEVAAIPLVTMQDQHSGCWQTKPLFQCKYCDKLQHVCFSLMRCQAPMENLFEPTMGKVDQNKDNTLEPHIQECALGYHHKGENGRITDGSNKYIVLYPLES